MELLAPAGSLSSAYAAFNGGADAVYIGGKAFSARASAINFTNEEIKEIIFYAHSINRKVYVTLNTLLFQDEFFEAVKFAKFLASICVDGVIIQDLGLAHYLHKVIPSLPLNASTQLNCHNLAQAKALIKIGFKRIVLARESSLEFAKQVKELGVEVEVFGHGALCVCYSGNCLLSSYIGGRSGNRGKCAQPCRMKYALLEDGKELERDNFAISTKDLMTVDRIDELLLSGIDSLKLEGRLKSEEYIYLVSKTYRDAIDGAEKKLIDEDKLNLKKAFNREFTKGYIFNESIFNLLNTKTSSHQGEVIGKVISANKNRVAIKLFDRVSRLDGIRFDSKEQFGLAIEKMFLNKDPVEIANKGDVIELSGIERAQRLIGLNVIRTKDYLLNKEINDLLRHNIKVNVSAKITAKVGKPLQLSVKYLDKCVIVEGQNVEAATGDGTNIDRIKSQLMKSGEFQYVISDIEFDIEKCFIPISMLNSLRNDAFKKLFDSFAIEKSVDEVDYSSSICPSLLSENNKAFVETPEQDEILSDNGFITYSIFDKNYHLEPRVTSITSFSHPHEVLNYIIEKHNSGDLIASQYTNITNSYALDCYYELGFNECILSLELDRDSIELMLKDFKARHCFDANVGYIVYGKMDMMLMKSCPIGTYFNNDKAHCNKCHEHKFELMDKENERYRLLGDINCNTRLLYSRPNCLFGKIDELHDMGISNLYFVFTEEGKEKVQEILKDFYDRKIINRSSIGHYNKRSL